MGTILSGGDTGAGHADCSGDTALHGRTIHYYLSITYYPLLSEHYQQSVTGLVLVG